MHRIDKANKEADKHGAGKDGFTEGDPAGGTEATSVSADILDALQEELCHVIEDSDGGNTALIKVNNEQLKAAIIHMAKPKVYTGHYNALTLVTGGGSEFNGSPYLFTKEVDELHNVAATVTSDGTNGVRVLATKKIELRTSFTCKWASLTAGSYIEIGISKNRSSLTMPNEGAQLIARERRAVHDVDVKVSCSVAPCIVLEPGEWIRLHTLGKSIDFNDTEFSTEFYFTASEVR